jgi:hypothetical protein
MTMKPASRSVRVLVVLLLLPTGAAAQSETVRARADRLFAEGKAALDAQRYGEACTKLAESQQLDPATGTLLALALCHEGQGRVATALREFKDVAAASDKARRSDRSTLARQRISALERRVPTVVVQLPPNMPAPPLRVELDGHVLTNTEIGLPFPIDPGSHVVEASQPSYRSVRVPGMVTERQQWTVALPRLESLNTPSPMPPPPVAATPIAPPAPVAAAPPPPPPPAADTGTGAEVDTATGTRTIGWISIGAGVAAIGVGSYFGIAALGNRSDAEKLCPASPCKSAEGVSKNDSAQTQAWIANIAVGVGIVGIGVGTYLVLRRDPAVEPRKAGARIVPTATPTGVGLMLDGRF